MRNAGDQFAGTCDRGRNFNPAKMSERIEKAEKLVDQFPENEMARFSLGKALFDENRFSEAQNELERALKKKPDWMVAQILIGKCQLARGEKQAAMESFKKARQLAVEQDHEGPLAEMTELLKELEGGN